MDFRQQELFASFAPRVMMPEMTAGKVGQKDRHERTSW